MKRKIFRILFVLGLMVSFFENAAAATKPIEGTSLANQSPYNLSYILQVTVGENNYKKVQQH